MSRLKRARDLIRDESRWCQEFLAKNRQGEMVEARSGEAVQWCAMGALLKIMGEKRISSSLTIRPTDWTLLYQAANNLYGRRISQVNDELGHEAVMKVYERAIQNENQYEKEQTILKENHQEERALETAG